MEESDLYSTSKLEHCSYRYLQQLAKSMKLPSNVKKIYLVEMINAVKCSPEAAVQRIVRRVKQERQLLTQAKRRSRRTVIPPDTSSDESASPPITNTPKRPPFLLRCSELRHQMMRPQNSLLRTISKPVASDRVLRSCNVKTVKRQYVNQYPGINEANHDTVDSRHVKRHVNRYVELNEKKEDMEDQGLLVERRYVNKSSKVNERNQNMVERSMLVKRQYVIKNSEVTENRDMVQHQGMHLKRQYANKSYESIATNQNMVERSMLVKRQYVIKNSEANENRDMVDQGLHLKRPYVNRDEVNENRDMVDQGMQARRQYVNKYSEVNENRNTVDQSIHVQRPYVKKYSEINERNQDMLDQSINVKRQYVNQYSEGDQSMNVKRQYVNQYSEGDQSMNVKRQYVNQYSELNENNRRDRHILDQSMNIKRQYDMVDQGTQMNTARVVKKYKPIILSSAQMSKDRQLVPVTQTGSSQILVKRQRRLSGIYPIDEELVQVGGVGVRASDGKMATLNAFVRRPQDRAEQTPCSTSLRRNIEMTIQDIINGNVDAQAASLGYPNTSGVSITPETETSPETTSSVYYHKKIRAEQVRERRMSSANSRCFEYQPYPDRCSLPRIGEAFDQFRGHHETRDVTQPIYVHVEPERTPQYPLAKNACLLETVYNFKNQFLTGQSLLKTTADTKCVFSTRVVPTAAPHRPAATSAEPYVASCERDSQYYFYTDSSRADELRFAPEYDIRCHEEQNTSGSSIGTAQSQELGANVTISDMVEDALELISQDGDYMERMGMDVRMQCVLCSWAGPKIILEYHIRKDHASEIDEQEKREWNITYTLGSIVSEQVWRCRVVSHGTSLYVLSVKHEPPGRLLATLSSLSPEPELATGSITIFNKVTGEPYTWCGDIQELPASLPYHTQPGLQVDLGDLDLVPNSANLKFLNGELVLLSPTKVVFGQLELNDIHIILFVKISD